MSDVDRALAKVAMKQHSLITLADVRRCGGTLSGAKRRVAAGRWDWCSEEVYRIAGVPWTYEARVLALVLGAGDGAVASHLCACRLSGLGFKTAPPEITIRRGTFYRPSKTIVHSSTDLQRCTTVKRQGIPTTDPARTLLDTAGLGRVGPRSLRRLVESTRRLELVDWHDLASCLAAHARKGRPGITRLRDVIAVGALNGGITDTDSELLALSLLREYGFGEPSLQHEIRDDDTGELRASMDLAYADRLVDLEIDGPVHLLPEVRRKDAARDLFLRRRGWTVRRIWWEIPIAEPGLFASIVRDTFAEAKQKNGGFL